MSKTKLSSVFRPSRFKYPFLALLTVIVISGCVFFYAKSEYIVLGAECYLFGYPLIIMDVTRTNTELLLGRKNYLHRVRQFPDADFKGVVRPNEDTLYINAFINADEGPWVFEMKPNEIRYAVMQFMDAWTNVFASLGTRTTGTGGGRFLLVGPSWRGKAPHGLILMRSPTQLVWLIGRIQTNGVSDYPTVHRLQDGIILSALADWQEKKVINENHKEIPEAPRQEAKTQRIPPIIQMQEMSVEFFFKRLAMLMVNNSPSLADGPMLVKLSRIGIKPGQPPNWNLLDRWCVALGRLIADFTVAKELKKPRHLIRGWSSPPAIIGNYGTFYNTRAVVAMAGLGANLPEDAIYPSTLVDSKERALNGRHRYRLHFRAGELPPVNAFWSITAYGTDNFFIPNPINRYSLGDRNKLVFNADGSLDIHVQSTQPEEAKMNNWLPVKDGEPFLLNARLYWPKPAALNGKWGMPAVERID